ncbi:MAG: hypothetical protein ACRER2_08425 [Methylococcales bacterium]
MRCGQPLDADGKKNAWTALDTVDMERVDENPPGLRSINTRHSYYEISCVFGCLLRERTPIVAWRMTRFHRLSAVNGAWSGRSLPRGWFVSPTACGLCANGLRNFLRIGWACSLLSGRSTIRFTKTARGRQPVEDERIQTGQRKAPLTHGDETSWMKRTAFFWF